MPFSSVAGIYTVVQYLRAGVRRSRSRCAGDPAKADNPRLYNIVENLSITTGLPMPKVYIINDPAPNAFSTGRDPKHAVRRGDHRHPRLMKDSELEGVMAHEMGHVQNYDIRVSTMVFGLVVAIGFIADILLRLSFFGGFGGNNNNNSGGGGNPIDSCSSWSLWSSRRSSRRSSRPRFPVSANILRMHRVAMITRNPPELESALDEARPVRSPGARARTRAWRTCGSPTRTSPASWPSCSDDPPIPDRIARLEKIGGTF